MSEHGFEFPKLFSTTNSTFPEYHLTGFEIFCGIALPTICGLII
jgi:hypothetical protein